MITINKKIFGTFSVSALILTSAFSCNNTGEQLISKIGFDTLRIDDTFRLESGKSLPEYRLTVDFVYPEISSDTAKLRSLQSALIGKFFADNFNSLTPKEALDSFALQQRSYFQSILSEEFLDEISLQDSVFAFYFNIKNKVVFCDGNLVSFLVENDGYEGGAHPYHNISGYVYSLAVGDFITEDAFAGTDYRKNLAVIISEKIRKYRNCKEDEKLEDVGFDSNEILPNGNFTIDNQGITYYYNEYEIAPYYIGMTKVFIPFEELAIYLKSENPFTQVYNK
jgi:hypothetical protein